MQGRAAKKASPAKGGLALGGQAGRQGLSAPPQSQAWFFSARLLELSRSVFGEVQFLKDTSTRHPNCVFSFFISTAKILFCEQREVWGAAVIFSGQR